MESGIIIKHTDGKLYQVYVSREQMKIILNSLMEQEQNGRLKIFDTPIKTIEFKTKNNQQKQEVKICKEEKIINGILHHRSSPDDEFKAYTAKELSQQVKYLRWKIENIGAEFEILSNKLKS